MRSLRADTCVDRKNFKPVINGIAAREGRKVRTSGENSSEKSESVFTEGKCHRKYTVLFLAG